ncbi:hypothetical protein Nham_3431 [Nitrobacter hamburgensis X14]|jgi:hypothetical protein|uniref:Uncharacterized protein n=1 Tax=Nitrobacter hamburgensis (strain DSM 10229 / NCIMB 13809 / X14) TaxID=323097 RepID=Q1QHY6_NITHX|nr:hypothetical protein [Nitrobacter hamburgensis]ABE64161.1 hypothetical protein Nham_3431 [Nitrobacter hamburgensis X14]
MNVIDSNILERDAGGKPLHTFPHPALCGKTEDRRHAFRADEKRRHRRAAFLSFHIRPRDYQPALENSSST